MDERRRAERLPITIPIKLGNGAGITRDVSGLGVYFMGPVELEAGQPLEFSLRIPGSIDVHCKGRVVRSEREADADAWGVAVTIDEYTAADEGQGDAPEAAIVLRELRLHHGA